jgi:hypothetical protein
VKVPGLATQPSDLERENPVSQKFAFTNWSTCTATLWRNERRAYQRCAVLLGLFAQLRRLHSGESARPPAGSGASAATPALPPRFSYLPVSLPTLRGAGSNGGGGSGHGCHGSGMNGGGGKGGEVRIKRSTYQVKPFYLSRETVLPIK